MNKKHIPDCLPRKLKKGYKNLWWTRHQLIERINLVQTEIDEIEAQGGRAMHDCYLEVPRLKEKLKHPYRVTKWTRKAERLPNVVKYLQYSHKKTHRQQ